MPALLQMTLWRGNEITSTLQTLISLDHLHCHNESDDIGSDEPYLWTAFFKIDGDTVILDRAADGRLVLDGTCTFVGTSGSHGNLGHTDVEEGDDVPIPAVLGEFGFSLTPIHATARTGLPPEYTVGGVVGAVVLLMEHESLTDDGAEAGHVTLNKALERERAQRAHPDVRVRQAGANRRGRRGVDNQGQGRS